MAKPHVHAMSSAKRYGGTMEDKDKKAAMKAATPSPPGGMSKTGAWSPTTSNNCGTAITAPISIWPTTRSPSSFPTTRSSQPTPGSTSPRITRGM